MIRVVTSLLVEVVAVELSVELLVVPATVAEASLADVSVELVLAAPVVPAMLADDVSFEVSVELGVVLLELLLVPAMVEDDVSVELGVVLLEDDVSVELGVVLLVAPVVPATVADVSCEDVLVELVSATLLSREVESVAPLVLVLLGDVDALSVA